MYNENDVSYETKSISETKSVSETKSIAETMSSVKSRNPFNKMMNKFKKKKLNE